MTITYIYIDGKEFKVMKSGMLHISFWGEDYTVRRVLYNINEIYK